MEKKQFKIGLGTAIMIFLLILILLASFAFYLINENNKNNNQENEIEVESNKDKEDNGEIDTDIKSTENIEVVPTMKDKIPEDSSWCATFQLVWNDMKNEVVGGDVVFDPQEKFAENLNKEEFTESMISEEYYYKKYGLKTLELKAEIEKGIKDKFNQESDVLDDINWSEDELNDPNNPDLQRYLFYVMLYRKFEFLKEFDKLDNGDFGTEYNDVKYFGINENTDESVREQIEVLYYNSKEDFAIVLKTKTNDEVILCKNPKGDAFEKIYANIQEETEEYEGKKYFTDLDKFKAPNLTFNIKREYTELADKKFKTKEGIGEIAKAIQTIKFSLDGKGGEIKSEAVIDMKENAALPIEEKEEPRYFYLDDTFAIFLKEEGKDVPYFAGRIQDITKFQ